MANPLPLPPTSIMSPEMYDQIRQQLQPTQGLLPQPQQPQQPRQPSRQAPTGGFGGPGGTQRMQQIYGLLAQQGQDPAAVGQQYIEAMQRQQRLDTQNRSQMGGPASPSSVREWEFYSELNNADQKRYLEMKRGVQLEKFGGSIVSPTTVPGQGAVYSTLGSEARGAETMATAKALGGKTANRFDILHTGRQERLENFSVAARLKEKVASNDLPTGLYTGLIYKVLPTGDQESLDGLAEFVARARLKANGEVRPTDADVAGAKKALFGSSRTEDFTIESLNRLMRELHAQETEYRDLSGNLGQRITSPLQQPLKPRPYTQPPNAGGLLNPAAPSAPQVDYSKMSVEEMLELQRRNR